MASKDFGDILETHGEMYVLLGPNPQVTSLIETSAVRKFIEKIQKVRRDVKNKTDRQECIDIFSFWRAYLELIGEDVANIKIDDNGESSRKTA